MCCHLTFSPWPEQWSIWVQWCWNIVNLSVACQFKSIEFLDSSFGVLSFLLADWKLFNTIFFSEDMIFDNPNFPLAVSIIIIDDRHLHFCKGFSSCRPRQVIHFSDLRRTRSLVWWVHSGAEPAGILVILSCLAPLLNVVCSYVIVLLAYKRRWWSCADRYFLVILTLRLQVG